MRIIETCIATQIPTNNATVATLSLVLIVFHLNRCEHPLPSVGELGPGSSNAVYLKSEPFLKRRDKFEGTRGIIFGK